jgi:hypothetical protein
VSSVRIGYGSDVSRGQTEEDSPGRRHRTVPLFAVALPLCHFVFSQKKFSSLKTAEFLRAVAFQFFPSCIQYI